MRRRASLLNTKDLSSANLGNDYDGCNSYGLPHARKNKQQFSKTIGKGFGKYGQLLYSEVPYFGTPMRIKKTHGPVADDSRNDSSEQKSTSQQFSRA